MIPLFIAILKFCKTQRLFILAIKFMINQCPQKLDTFYHIENSQISNVFRNLALKFLRYLVQI